MSDQSMALAAAGWRGDGAEMPRSTDIPPVPPPLLTAVARNSVVPRALLLAITLGSPLFFLGL